MADIAVAPCYGGKWENAYCAFHTPDFDKPHSYVKLVNVSTAVRSVLADFIFDATRAATMVKSHLVRKVVRVEIFAKTAIVVPGPRAQLSQRSRSVAGPVLPPLRAKGIFGGQHKNDPGRWCTYQRRAGSATGWSTTGWSSIMRCKSHKRYA